MLNLLAGGDVAMSLDVTSDVGLYIKSDCKHRLNLIEHNTKI